MREFFIEKNFFFEIFTAVTQTQQRKQTIFFLENFLIFDKVDLIHVQDECNCWQSEQNR